LHAAGEFDVCTLFFSRFKSVIAQIQPPSKLFSRLCGGRESSRLAWHEYEPDEEEISGACATFHSGLAGAA
jgi:F-type H+-transporting ATPase subunit gamma